MAFVAKATAWQGLGYEQCPKQVHGAGARAGRGPVAGGGAEPWGRGEGPDFVSGAGGPRTGSGREYYGLF